MPPATPSATSGTCVHHWILGTPQGEVCHASCKHCGCERDFVNESFPGFRLKNARKQESA
jgi:hypothetical protein